MSPISRRKIRLKTKTIFLRMIALKKCVASSWKRVVGCLMQLSVHNNHRTSDHNNNHHHLETYSSPASSPPPSINGAMSPCSDDDADLVSIKVCILGDPKIGKTSFLVSQTHICMFKLFLVVYLFC